jgi:nitroreductase
MKPEMANTLPLHPLIRGRWSPHSFADRPLENETIFQLFEAARWAASCANGQPWRFIWAAKADAEKHARLFACLTDANKLWVKTAPLLILALVKTTFGPGNKPNRWAFYDLGLAIGNLTTQATSLGLYVHNMAGFLPDLARTTFNLPADIEPVTMIAAGALGDPGVLPSPFKEREAAPQQRRPLEELFFA